MNAKNLYFSTDPHYSHANIMKLCDTRIQFMNNNEKLEMKKYHLLVGTPTELQIAMNNIKISDESILKMNDEIIRRWNERVKPDDEAYLLGDILFYRSTNGNGLKIKPHEILNRLNGKITYVRGNHDENNGMNIKNHRIVIYISKMFVNLVHNPEHGNLDYELNLCGHVHDKWKFKTIERNGKKSLFINVGVDVWNFYPVPWQKLYEIFNQWKAGKNVEELYS